MAKPTDYLSEFWRRVRNEAVCGWCTGSEFLTPGGGTDDTMRCIRRTSVRCGRLIDFEQRACPEFRVMPEMVEDAMSETKRGGIV